MCNHLEHNVEIDRNFNRQHPGVIEINKLNKLMIAVDRGDLLKFQNKNLNDVEGLCYAFINIIPEQFTAKAHPALFEGEGGAGEGGGEGKKN